MSIENVLANITTMTFNKDFNYDNYVRVYTHIMKTVDPKSAVWNEFAKVLTNNFLPLTSEEIKKGGRTFKIYYNYYMEMYENVL